MQRTIGNQAVQRMLVSNPTDASEREADQVAADVTAATPTPCSCGSKNQIQRKASSASAAAPPEVNNVLRSTGRPLDPQTSAAMSSRFGRDFSHVQVHTDERAAASAEALNAEAYTVGHQIAFRHGRYSPSTTAGRRLLAHELTHVVQQGHAGPSSGAAHAPGISQPPSAAVQRTATPDDEKRKKEAVERHINQQKNVADLLDQGRKLTVDPSRGLLDNDNLFRNSIEMLDTGHVRMTIYTPIHDDMTRNPGERTYFDSRVDYPKTGGDYPADPAIKSADGMRTERPGVEGTMFTVHPKVPGFMGLFTDDSLMSMDELKQTFVHEVQHAADLHLSPIGRVDPPIWQDRFEDYKTEFRSFWVQPAPLPPPPKQRRPDELIFDPGPTYFPIGGPMKPFSPATTVATNKDKVKVQKPGDCKVCPTPPPAKAGAGKKPPAAPTPNDGVQTHLRNKRQEEIFWHLINNYKTRQFDCWYVCSPEFRAAVENFDNPLSIDLINSVRIFELYDTVLSIKPTADSEEIAFKKGLFSALKKLDALDWLFLKSAGSAPPPARGAKPAPQTMLAAPLWEKVDAHFPPAMAARFHEVAAQAEGKPSEWDIMSIFDDTPSLLHKKKPGDKK